MPVPKRKSLESEPKKLKKPKKPFPVGPDGKTGNQRLREILGSHPVVRREKDLWRACNELLGTTEDDPDFVLQQSINRILRDQDSLSRSKLVVVIAEAVGVRPFWLQTGRGERVNRSEAILKEILQRHGIAGP